MRCREFYPIQASPLWKYKALWKKVHPKILIRRWSTFDLVEKNMIFHDFLWFRRISCLFTIGFPIVMTWYYLFPRWDHFWEENASLIGRRSSSNQYFWMNFFKSALDFHGGDAGRGVRSIRMSNPGQKLMWPFFAVSCFFMRSEICVSALYPANNCIYLI